MMEAARNIGLTPAPFDQKVSGGQTPAESWWLKAEDGTRLRMATWSPPAEAPARGTILIFNGRTEFCEKYGWLADEFTAAGFHTATLDWRGQGASDRPLPDPHKGHVESFELYQQDVRALQGAAQTLTLPRPWFVIGHSLGGAVALRALQNGLPVSAAVFTGPMWGIEIPPVIRPFTKLLLGASRLLGFENRYALTRGPRTPMPFDGNDLTSDAEAFAHIEGQIDALPDLVLGGPTYGWVDAALQETGALMDLPAPDIPTLTFVGSDEAIVSFDAARDYMTSWPNGAFIPLAHGRHEVFFERPELREPMIARILDHFAQHATA